MRSTTAELPKYAKGGPVTGGSGVRDDVPILAKSGEYVISQEGVDAFGTKALDAINKGQLPEFAKGGQVGNGRKVRLYKEDNKAVRYISQEKLLGDIYDILKQSFEQQKDLFGAQKQSLELQKKTKNKLVKEKEKKREQDSGKLFDVKRTDTYKLFRHIGDQFNNRKPTDSITDKITKKQSYKDRFKEKFLANQLRKATIAPNDGKTIIERKNANKIDRPGVFVGPRKPSSTILPEQSQQPTAPPAEGATMGLPDLIGQVGIPQLPSTQQPTPKGKGGFGSKLVKGLKGGAAGLGATLLLDGISDYATKNDMPNLAAGTDVLGTAATGAGFGALVGGPIGAAIGGLAGGAYGLYENWDKFGSDKAEEKKPGLFDRIFGAENTKPMADATVQARDEKSKADAARAAAGGAGAATIINNINNSMIGAGSKGGNMSNSCRPPVRHQDPTLLEVRWKFDYPKELGM
jgi:hypothetical protein